eukprot:10349543-Alexandrium_andersonii.AAC.1
MSASLVGSEMCIRDRTACCAVIRLLQNVRRRWSKGQATAGALGSPPTPVSYTHLTLPTICSV